MKKLILNLKEKISSLKKNKKNNFQTFCYENYPIELSFKEREFLIEKLSKAENYLEFGSGGSTFLSILKANVKNIISVESDENWIKYMRRWGTISDAENSGRLKFVHVNIGKTGDWGVPLEIDKNKYLFPNYSKVPFERNQKFDVIFIDGRFRVACAIQSILNSPSETKILMHDFNNRSYYHSILDFLQI